MAKILFGVMGDALGHVYQALTIAQELPQHDFLFLGSGRTLTLRSMGYRVIPVPMFGTAYRNNRVHVAVTLRHGLNVFRGSGQSTGKVMDIIRDFKPDLILSAYEYFVPLAAKKLGRNCISIDNQHFLTKCRSPLPEGQILSRLMFTLPLRLMYSNADKYFINTFFQCSPSKPKETEVFPPLLRSEVLKLKPSDRDHVLVYQTSPTFKGLFNLLEGLPNRYIVYGFGGNGTRKNVVYKETNDQTFLRDLASCRYVITNGGHNVIAEALFFGKPVLSFPIMLAYEQFFNAHMLAYMGYGDYCLDAHPDLSILENFESRLAGCRSRIAKAGFFGNRRMANRLEQVIQSQEGLLGTQGSR